MAGFADFIVLLKDFGVFEFYLPFVIMFALMYGLLRKSEIFGKHEDKRANSLNIIISLAAAFYIMAYTPVGVTLTMFFSNFFTQVSVVFVTIIAFMMIIGLLTPLTGKKSEEAFKVAGKLILIFGALIALAMFLSSGGQAIFPAINLSGIGIPSVQISPEMTLFIILAALTILAIWFISKEEKGSEKRERGITAGHE